MDEKDKTEILKLINEISEQQNVSIDSIVTVALDALDCAFNSFN